MTVRNMLITLLGTSALLAGPASAQTRVPVPTSSVVLMPVPPAGSANAPHYQGHWQGQWQDRHTYRGDWNGSYVANAPSDDPEARMGWLGECRQRLTASARIGDQGRIAEACEGWLAYFQAVGPNQAGSDYGIPVMLVPVVTGNDCVTEVSVERPVRHYRPIRRAPILHDKRVRILPD